MKRLVALFGCAAVTAAAVVFQSPLRGAGLPPAPAGKLTVTFAEMNHTRQEGGVGGLAVILQTPGGRTYLYDTGWPTSGRNSIEPLLKEQKVTEIAAIIASHPHLDHFGSTAYLAERYQVKRFIGSYDKMGGVKEYLALIQEFKGRGIEYQVVYQGDKLDWGKDLEVEVLAPPRGFLEETDPKKLLPPETPAHYYPHLNSMVLRVRHGKNVFLLTGDLTPTGQDYLRAQHPKDKLRTTVLSAPCHGYCADVPFARVAEPKVVVVSCRTDVTAPANDSKRIYSQVGSEVYATPWHGHVQVVSDGEGYAVHTVRKLPEGEKPRK